MPLSGANYYSCRMLITVSVVLVVLIVPCLPFERVNCERGVIKARSRHSLEASRSQVRAQQVPPPTTTTTSANNTRQTAALNNRRVHRATAPELIDSRNLPSPLPKRKRTTAIRSSRKKLEQQDFAASNMRLDGPMKRSAGDTNASSETIPPTSTSEHHKHKRFRTSGRFTTSNSNSSSSSMFTLNGSTSSAMNDDNQDMNNNNSTALPRRQVNDMNNNSIDTEGGGAQPSWRQNIDSVNGTVDLSQYNQNDVDRLYGDALLVYFKNFNE